MEEQLTIKDLNCSTCSLKGAKCKFGLAEMTLEMMKTKGCASHPMALQVLAGPVIKELEQRAIVSGNAGNYHRTDAYNNAIHLLKGEK